MNLRIVGRANELLNDMKRRDEISIKRMRRALGRLTQRKP
jgi:hypothetical protein